MNAAGLVKGWCPGALRPMEANDGLILRVRPRLSRLPRAQLAAIGEIAGLWGDGRVHLTRRANLQIRGIAAASHELALHRLAAFNLVDANPAAEAVRNILVAPYIALCPSDPVAARAAQLAARLEEALEGIPVLHRLSGKFGIGVQAGPTIEMSGAGDVTFAVQDDAILLMLEGDPIRTIAFPDAQAAVDGFRRIAEEFIRLSSLHPDVRRMRHAVARVGADAILCVAGKVLERHRLRVGSFPAPVGAFNGLFGIGFPFGELSLKGLHAVHAFMERHDIEDIALSAHRVLVLPLRTASEEAALRDLARRIGAIADPGDVRLRMHACPGSPACASGTVSAQADAEAALAHLEVGTTFKGVLHVSGCSKGCAFTGEADITAVGFEGRYEVRVRGAVEKAAVTPQDLPRAIAQWARLFA
jgi:precorrin-3B synthase